MAPEALAPVHRAHVIGRSLDGAPCDVGRPAVLGPPVHPLLVRGLRRVPPQTREYVAVSHAASIHEENGQWTRLRCAAWSDRRAAALDEEQECRFWTKAVVVQDRARRPDLR